MEENTKNSCSDCELKCTQVPVHTGKTLRQEVMEHKAVGFSTDHSSDSVPKPTGEHRRSAVWGLWHLGFCLRQILYIASFINYFFKTFPFSFSLHLYSLSLLKNRLYFLSDFRFTAKLICPLSPTQSLPQDQHCLWSICDSQ